MRTAALLPLLLLLPAAPAQTPAPTPAPAPARTRLGDLYRRVSPSLVQVLGAGGIRGVASRGTGVVLSVRGHILTYDSIGLQPGKVRVAFLDGIERPVKILARDPKLGLAMLKVDLKRPLVPARIPPVGTRPGPGGLVLLLGFPFKVAGPGEKASAFFGLVKARLRLDLRLGKRVFPLDREVLLTDAPNNPGAQGGGLFDLQGNLIGSVGRLVESTETNTLVSYSLPIDVVRPFIDKVLHGRKTHRPAAPPPPLGLAVLGVKLFDFGLRTSPPAYVHKVRPGSPAARAGLRPDDLILELAGRPVRTCRELHQVLGRIGRPKRLDLLYKRGTRVHRTTLTLTTKEER